MINHSHRHQGKCRSWRWALWDLIARRPDVHHSNAITATSWIHSETLPVISRRHTLPQDQCMQQHLAYTNSAYFTWYICVPDVFWNSALSRPWPALNIPWKCSVLSNLYLCLFSFIITFTYQCLWWCFISVVHVLTLKNCSSRRSVKRVLSEISRNNSFTGSIHGS